MMKAIFTIGLILAYNMLLAQNEVGPDGDKLLWFFLFIFILIGIGFVLFVKSPKHLKNIWSKLFERKRIQIQLKKDRNYYPDFLTMVAKNSGNVAIDLDRPLLIFDNFWFKRKFRLKGVNNARIYPLFLEKEKTHSLNIDLNHFYKHDKSLKKYSKTKVVLFDVNGKKCGSATTFLRKTLFKW